MEAEGVAVVQRVPVTMLREEAALLRQDTAKVRDDVQESSIRRAYRDEPAQQGISRPQIELKIHFIDL
jgi:hypothetical protein